MQLKRTALTAIVIAVAAAPNAPAMPIRDPGTVPAKQHTIKPAQSSTRFEEEAVLRGRSGSASGRRPRARRS